MAEKYAIGVDLGGTQVRAALSDGKDNFIAKLEEEVDKKSRKAISDQIVRMIRSLFSEGSIDSTSLRGIGIASTGPIDQEKGVLTNPTNLPFKSIPLTNPISNKINTPAYLLNDCIAGVLGEKEFGAGRGLDNLTYITLSTGIGGGAIIDGHLLLGKDGNAVEIGHLTIDCTGRLKCGSGTIGHWEAYCSGRNIPNFIRMRLKEENEKEIKNSLLFKSTGGDFSKLSPKILFEAAKSGDKLSLRLIKEIGRLNAIGFATVINAYDPSLITVGGSVALKNKKLVMDPIKKYVKNYTVNRIPRITITPLGEDVSLYGAIAVILSPSKWTGKEKETG